MPDSKVANPKRWRRGRERDGHLESGRRWQGLLGNQRTQSAASCERWQSALGGDERCQTGHEIRRPAIARRREFLPRSGVLGQALRQAEPEAPDPSWTWV